MGVLTAQPKLRTYTHQKVAECQSSDPADVRCTAQRDGELDHYVVHGRYTPFDFYLVLKRLISKENMTMVRMRRSTIHRTIVT